MPDPVQPPVAPKPNWFVTFLGSQGFHSFYHALLAGLIGYITANGLPAGNETAHWGIGLLSSVLGAIVGWLNGKPTTSVKP